MRERERGREGVRGRESENVRVRSDKKREERRGGRDRGWIERGSGRVGGREREDEEREEGEKEVRERKRKRKTATSQTNKYRNVTPCWSN